MDSVAKVGSGKFGSARDENMAQGIIAVVTEINEGGGQREG